MKKTILFFILLWSVNCKAQGTWSNLGSGIHPIFFGVLALCADTVNNALYAGGEFDSAGSIKQNSLAKWDGTKWDTTISIDSGKWVFALIMYKGNLIIGFSDGSVGKYNGSTFQYLPGFDQNVYCFYIYNDTLYAGGGFTQSGSTSLNRIAKWNGTGWMPVDGGVSWYNCCADVKALTGYNGDLIASGTFDSAGSVGVTSIAAYDGSKWRSLGVNLSEFGSIPYNSTLEVYKNKLYVQGLFDSVNSVYNIGGAATWDGTNWDTIFSNTDNSFIETPNNAMKSFNGYLFDAGRYNLEVPYKYDEDELSTVDSGVIGGYIYAMTSWNGSLCVGGDFDTAGKSVSAEGIARWTPDTATGIKKLETNNNQLSISPNPFSQQTTFQFSQPITNNTRLTLYDLTGREVENYTISGGTKNLIIKRNNLPAGMYFYKVTGNGMPPLTGKVVIE